MNYLFAIGLCALVTFTWAVICFVWFCFIPRETAERQRRYLEKMVFFFTFQPFSPKVREMTLKTMRQAGYRGWFMMVLGVQLLSHGMTTPNLLAAVSCGYICGLEIAYAWYGLRCMRMLGLEVYEKVGK